MLERHNELVLDPETKALLLQMSASTIDRRLAPFRQQRGRDLSTTKPGTLLKDAIPVLPGIGELWAARQTVIGDTFSDSYREQAEAVHRIRGTRAAYLTFVRSQYTSPTSLRLVDGTYEDIEMPVLQMHGAHYVRHHFGHK